MCFKAARVDCLLISGCLTYVKNALRMLPLSHFKFSNPTHMEGCKTLNKYFIYVSTCSSTLLWPIKEEAHPNR